MAIDKQIGYCISVWGAQSLQRGKPIKKRLGLAVALCDHLDLEGIRRTSSKSCLYLLSYYHIFLKNVCRFCARNSKSRYDKSF
jgi:hypothetical protein